MFLLVWVLVVLEPDHNDRLLLGPHFLRVITVVLFLFREETERRVVVLLSLTIRSLTNSEVPFLLGPRQVSMEVARYLLKLEPHMAMVPLEPYRYVEVLVFFLLLRWFLCAVEMPPMRLEELSL